MSQYQFLNPKLEPSAYFDRLLDCVLCVVIEEPSDADDEWSARVFPTSEGDFILCFESEMDLSNFLNGAAHFVQVPARTLIERSAHLELGLAVNLGTGFENTVPKDVIAWLAAQLEVKVSYGDQRPAAFDYPERLSVWHSVLAEKLQTISDILPHFYWVKAQFGEEFRAALVFLDVPGEIAQTIAETAFQTVSLLDRDKDGNALDRPIEVLFLAVDDPLVLPMIDVAKVIEVPVPDIQGESGDTAQGSLKGPGFDPSAPPILR